ncbi:VRR-NUC domain-containing protein [Arthrobacter sp. NPDC056691]|uniref:VRR-NUC domain-containing protein n=1 Tax=Arthrobacter sp. NPDC056691 TaxID=3345913 RepID=UPI00367209D9
MTTPARRENHIESYLLSRCRANGFLCLKFVSPGRGGVPDRIVVAPNSTVFVEVKRPGGVLEKRQRITHARMRRHGAEIHVVDDGESVDGLVAHLLESRTDQQGEAS